MCISREHQIRFALGRQRTPMTENADDTRRSHIHMRVQVQPWAAGLLQYKGPEGISWSWAV